MKELLVIGNCQAMHIARLLARHLPGVPTHFLRLLPATLVRLEKQDTPLAGLDDEWRELPRHVQAGGLVLVQQTGDALARFLREHPAARERTRAFPRIDFNAFHPDMIHIGGTARSPTAQYHSAIVCAAWNFGADVDSTIGLFRDEVFESLGAYQYRASAERWLLQAGRDAGLDLDDLLPGWYERGVWMHTMNHPAGFVLADMVRAILEREGIASPEPGLGSDEDPLANGPSWGVYPEVARRLGVEGGYRFKAGGRPARDPQARIYDLETFVRGSFALYAKQRKEDLGFARLATARYQALRGLLRPAPPARKSAPAGAAAKGNPYQGLPDHQFWRRSMELPAAAEVDPVVRAPFRIGTRERVATAGSCFAQHIARTLAANGFNYYVTEDGAGLDADERQARNFGVFSARYGNLYTARQLLQLFDRAHGKFTPQDDSWRREDGRLVDPFRPQIEPAGFADRAALRAARREHLAAVRKLFRTLDVFVFTLGLTESWESRLDGAVYPLAPGVAGGRMDPARYAFRNSGAAEVTADLQAFVERLRGVNPGARIILTVSPVPLIATYEERHVLVSTTWSKSVLRVAAEEICQRNSLCAYFPSYEIITGNHARGAYFEDDLRSVRPEGVAHVMRLFLQHCAAKAPASSLEEELMRENLAAAAVVCDEEAIDAGS